MHKYIGKFFENEFLMLTELGKAEKFSKKSIISKKTANLNRCN